MPANDSGSAIEARLRTDLIAAMKARDQVHVDTLRLALGAFHNEEVARTDSAHKQHRQPLTETDRLALLEKQIKQRQEAAGFFRQAGRVESAEKEEREASILQAYLPLRMTDDELRALIAGLIAQHGREFRTIMPLASRETRGRADGKRVQELVRELTA
ncbi:MAG TPA: GatB/YqeY domain-containing protein [Ktedonobacterales bacterium]|nr:GatB/YqeY domain-containing protein [Ktedonobacterales bacterium]